jgi:hypothetical protein
VRHITRLGICLIVACGIGVVAAGTASAALPEWGKCVKFLSHDGKGVGLFSNNACTTLAEPAKTGEWEWKPAPQSIPSPAFKSRGG